MRLKKHFLPADSVPHNPLRGPRLALAVLGIILFAAWARGDVIIAPENRVPNRIDHGVCWWAAAETVGKQFGVTKLHGLSAAVVQDGLGWKEGATDLSIGVWLKKRGVVAEPNTLGKTTAGATWVAKAVDKGVPVITCHQFTGSPMGHSILNVKFDRDTQLVHYVDSNFVSAESTMPYDRWYKTWGGRAYAIDPKANLPAHIPPAVALAPPPAPSVVLPYPPSRPLTYPSNQDIKDGVRRPDDTLRYGLFGDVGGTAPGYDYYRDAKRARP